MKLVQMNCPACGATLDVEHNRKTLFCTYCGSKLMVDDGIARIEINQNINYHKTYTDEAKIKKHESEERIERMRLEYEEREKKRNDMIALGLIGLLLLMAVVCFCVGRFLF